MTGSYIAREKCEEGVTRFVKDRSPALTTVAADRSWTLATGAGVVVAVVAGLAGNRATASETADGASFAAAYPGVIGVAATDAKNVVTEDSIHGEHVSLAAPGYSVVTAFRDWGDCVYGTQGQSSSFATGHVSAAAHSERAPPGCRPCSSCSSSAGGSSAWGSGSSSVRRRCSPPRW